MKVDVEVNSNVRQVKEEAEEAIIRVLEACGQQAVSHAKNNLKEAGRIDTGLLRNSITYARSGERPYIESYRGNNSSKYSNSKNVPSGSYNGTAPNDGDGKKAVYIGTNVEYAPYIEAGTDRIPASHFLQRAVTEHSAEYQGIAKQYMS